MIRVGIIGFGFMGRMHFRCWRARRDAVVTAICDTDAAAVKNTGRPPGNIAGAACAADLRDVAVYADPEAMFARERLDAVSIAVPSHLHAAWTVRALEAGVHVLCEKPMALTRADGQRMMEAAEKRKAVLQIGHCIRFWPEYAKAKEIVESGRYGRVIAASFLRLSATARTKQGSWFDDEERSGGMVFDLHIHDTDFIQSLFGIPESVCSHGARMPTGGLAHIVTHYRYPDAALVTAEGGWAMTPSCGLHMRFTLVLENAVLAFDYAQTPALKVFPLDGEPYAPELPPGDAYAREIDHFVRAVRGDRTAAVITPRQAWNSLAIAEAERESARQEGRPIHVSTETF